MTARPRLARVTPENVIDACRLRVAPEQEKFVAPVAQSLAEAYAQPDTAWPRLVYDGERLVGFVMAAFDPSTDGTFRCGVWRLNIAEAEQGKGYGRFAVREVLAEAKRRGEARAVVLWVEGDSGPEDFYRRLGFQPTGEIIADQTVAEVFLDGRQPAPVPPLDS